MFSLVGGIYTVLKTKTGHMVEQLGDRYLLIGPYNESQVQLEVEVEDQPDTPELAATVRSMRERGVKVGFLLMFINIRRLKLINVK